MPSRAKSMRTGPDRGSPPATWDALNSATGGRAMFSMGTTTRRSSAGRALVSTMATDPGAWGSADAATFRAPPSQCATSSTGRTVADSRAASSSIGCCVADSPMRWGRSFVSCWRRSRDSARWAPRFVPAITWISSTITVCTVRKRSRALPPRIR